MRCNNCGCEINNANFCPNCGKQVEVEQNYQATNNSQQVVIKKTKLGTARLILGIISCLLFVLISFQSCAVGLSNALTSNGEQSGSAGFLSAICLVTAGIIGIVTHKSEKKVSCFIACGFYWFIFFLSRLFSGNYSDLKVWGFLAFAFGCVFLFTPLKGKKANIIGAVVMLIYFVLGVI